MKTPRPPLCLTLIIAATFFAFGCQRAAEPVNDSRETPKANTEPPAAEPPAPRVEITKSTDPKTAIAEAYRRTFSVSHFTTFKIGDGSVMGEAFREPNGDSWSESRMVAMSTEVIKIGDTKYTRANGEEWEKAPREKSMFDDSKNYLRYNDLKFAGTENLDGKKAFVYTFKWIKSAAPQNPKPIIDGKVWVSAETGMLLREDLSGDGAPSSLTYDYDRKVKLEPPIK